MMKYLLNKNILSADSTFVVPNDVADKHIKLATTTQIKVLLLALRTQKTEIDENDISSVLGIALNEVTDALEFWAGAGVIAGKHETMSEAPNRKKAVALDERPSRTDVAVRGNEDSNIRIILQKAQSTFGRNLKTNEASTFVWLYDDMGVSFSIMLLLLQYAADRGKCNIKFIESTAVRWLNSGIETVAEAEKMIAEELERDLSWEAVKKAFGIDRAKPSKKEAQYSEKWVGQYGFSAEMLKCAYDVCVDATAKISFPYIDAVLEKWYKNGIKKPEDIQKENNPKPKKADGVKNSGGYDISAFEDFLNSDD